MVYSSKSLPFVLIFAIRMTRYQVHQVLDEDFSQIGFVSSSVKIMGFSYS